MKIQESAENYLESILKLKEELSRVRAIDIVNELGFSKPSVSIAMKNLKENGYINISDNGSIELTEKGFEIANKTYNYQQASDAYYMSLGIGVK